MEVWGQCSYWASELPSPWLGRKGSGDGQGLLFGIDDVEELRLEGSTAHKEAIHIRLACQLLAGCPRPRTPISDVGTLSHCIRDVGLKPSPELFMYFLGLEQEARLRPSFTGEKTLGSSGDRQCGLQARTLGLQSHPGPGMSILGQVTLFSPFIIYLVFTCSMQD